MSDSSSSRSNPRRSWPPAEGVWFNVLSKAELVRPIEHFLVRHTGVSLVTWVTRCNRGLEYIPTLLLTTVGRRSGQLHDAALGYCVHDGNVVIVGSLGGAARHPAWYLNLQAHPLAWITVNRQRAAVDTRTAEGEERTAIWASIKERVPEYEAYERRAAGKREIPVIVCEARTPLRVRPW